MRDLDRISRLPDPILHQILSSLPTTQEAVKTSILSKRWRYLCLSVTTLSLRLNSGFHLDYVFIKKRSVKRSQPQYDAESLRLFLGRMLQHLNNSSIQMQTLRLSWRCRQNPDEPLLDECLRVAAKRSVQHLDLSLYPGEIPPWVFASQSLLTLRLDCFKIYAEEVRLCRLTKLELSSVDFGMTSAAKLVYGCTALRHLTIVDCFVEGDLDISSHMLQALNLIRTSCSGVLSVSASDLLSFHLDLCNSRGCPLRCLSYAFDVARRPTSLDILEVLHNVRELELGPYVLEILFGKIITQGKLPTFSKMKKLKLNTYLGSGPIQAITCILQCFPSLEELVITRCQACSFHRKLLVLSEPSEDFLGNLKLVKLHGFPCDRSEEATQGYINFWLSNAKGPEKKLIAKLFEN